MKALEIALFWDISRTAGFELNDPEADNIEQQYKENSNCECWAVSATQVWLAAIRLPA